MKKVTIVFTRPKYSYQKFPILSWIIRLLEGTNYSHIAAIFHSNTIKRDLVYQASGLYVHFMGKKLFDTRAEIIAEYTLNISDSAHKKALQFAVDNAQKPYGIKQIIGIGIVILAKKIGKKIQNPFKDGQYSYVCSELIASMIPGLKKEFKDNLDSVTPRDIKEYLDS